MAENLDSYSGGKVLRRREFIKRTALTAAGAAATLAAGPTACLNDEPVTVNGLPGAILGRTGLKVTSISFGGIMITEPRVLVRAIDRGINLAHLAIGRIPDTLWRPLAGGEQVGVHAAEADRRDRGPPEGGDEIRVHGSGERHLRDFQR